MSTTALTNYLSQATNMITTSVRNRDVLGLSLLFEGVEHAIDLKENF
jgi:hypothetical protein